MKTTLREVTTANTETYLVFVTKTDECLGRVYRVNKPGKVGLTAWTTDMTVGIIYDSRSEAIAALIQKRAL